jgi:uncharacterized LabA/DUF88 family protein
MERTVVLIDAGYLDKIIKKYYNEVKINMLTFSTNLCIGCERIQTYYYDSMPFQSGNPNFEERRRYARKDKYINRIKKLDKFTIKLGHCLKYHNGTYSQKGVDVEFALDLSELCTTDAIDKAIIVSGDSDFVPAVERANKLGVITQNVYSPYQFSYHLRDKCIETREINQQLIDSSLLIYDTPKK